MNDQASAATNTTQSVGRALSILRCFTDEHPQLRVSDIAEQVKLPQSTVSRLLKSMESLEFVARDPDSGAYRPGLQLVSLAGIVLNQMPLRSEGMVELSAMAAETGLAANLAILRDDALFYLASVEGPRAPKLFTMMGRQGPLHSTGMGKILLAHLPDDEREAALARIAYPRYTPHTAGSVEELRPMLDEALGRGYASEREELAFGRACLASPVRDARGRVVAATSISGPLSELDLDRREPELAQRVIEMADRISRRLGWVAMPSVPVRDRRRAAPVPGGDGQA